MGGGDAHLGGRDMERPGGRALCGTVGRPNLRGFRGMPMSPAGDDVVVNPDGHGGGASGYDRRAVRGPDGRSRSFGASRRHGRSGLGCGRTYVTPEPRCSRQLDSRAPIMSPGSLPDGCRDGGATAARRVASCTSTYRCSDPAQLARRASGAPASADAGGARVPLMCPSSLARRCLARRSAATRPRLKRG